MIRKVGGWWPSIENLRVLVSTLFLFLGGMKIYVLAISGLGDYRAFIDIVGLPKAFVYYGVVALLIELYLAIGIWFIQTFISAIVLTLCLSLAGVSVSIYSLVFKLNSACGCGLLGDNEYGILAQKLGIVVTLVFLLIRRSALIFDE